MKELISDTEISTLEKKVTNHSGRKTLVKKLRAAKVTGHTSTKELSNYDPGDQQEFRGVSNAISGKHPNVVPVSVLKESCSSNVSVFNNCTFNIKQKCAMQ